MDVCLFVLNVNYRKINQGSRKVLFVGAPILFYSDNNYKSHSRSLVAQTLALEERALLYSLVKKYSEVNTNGIVFFVKSTYGSYGRYTVFAVIYLLDFGFNLNSFVLIMCASLITRLLSVNFFFS